ncbi:DUF3592 domain-containing protein [Saccharibacillus deserti]|uniref:DUF3592 domain-containing protein n=1 Tax=Saccharibacillus deserti TaxID=1634444 RepID=UPI0015544713|nr:DUF3592 domain-containing protein [Saccharibacillus deserti]
MSGSGSEIIFWVLGLLCIAFGLYSGVRQRRLAQSEHTVPGEIIRYEELADTGFDRASTGIKYYPVVRFLAGNVNVERVSQLGSSAPQPPIGTKVEVHYRPDNTAAFEILSGTDALRKQTGPIVLGVVFLAVGFALLL